MLQPVGAPRLRIDVVRYPVTIDMKKRAIGRSLCFFLITLVKWLAIGILLEVLRVENQGEIVQKLVEFNRAFDSVVDPEDEWEYLLSLFVIVDRHSETKDWG